jgi:hypothetical protein
VLPDLARPKTACAAAWLECANPCRRFLSCTTRGSSFDPSCHPIMRDPLDTTYAQSQTNTAGSDTDASTTITDFFVMIGSDFDRPGLLPCANYDIGIGHTFGFLKKDPIGDELAFGYTCENAGSHGFLHTSIGEHTESAGVVTNPSLPRTKTVTGYTWIRRALRVIPVMRVCETGWIAACRWEPLFTSTIRTPSGFRRATARWSRCRGTRQPALATRTADQAIMQPNT